MLIGVGSNVPFRGMPPVAVVASAIEELRLALPDGFKASRLWVGPSVPNPSDPPVVNAAVCAEIRWPQRAVDTETGAVIEDGLDHDIAVRRQIAKVCLDGLMACERSCGRERTVRNGPRTLDLDLLAIGDFVCRPQFGDDLELPHPRLHLRPFVLGPLLEVAPDWVHPVLELSVRHLWRALPPAPEYRPIDG